MELLGALLVGILIGYLAARMEAAIREARYD